MRKGGNGKTEETVISKVREVETVKVNVDDITIALRNKLRDVVVETMRDVDFINPVKKDFKYPDPKPYDYPVKIPIVDPNEVKVSTETVIREVLNSINMPSIVKSCMEKEELKRYEIVDVPLKVPVPDINEIKEMMVSTVREAFKAMDLKSLLIEALGTVDMPIPCVIPGETHELIQVKKGRTVTEHTIIDRNKIQIHTVHQIKDEQGNLITTLKSGDE